MSMQTTSDNDLGEPMIDMNVTPLIDVMLVLLIMFIITIPIQTHAVKLDLPVNQQNQPPPPIDPVKNKVVINAQDQVLWNGAPVSMPQLRAVSRYDAADEPDPGAPPPAGRDRSLRDGRPGAGRHQASARPEDGLRRQRILYERLLRRRSEEVSGRLRLEPPFSFVPDWRSLERHAIARRNDRPAPFRRRDPCRGAGHTHAFRHAQSAASDRQPAAAPAPARHGGSARRRQACGRRRQGSRAGRSGTPGPRRHDRDSKRAEGHRARGPASG